MALFPFGHVGTARAGDLFDSHHELAERGQHRPLRAGVCATAQHGAESIILADQYEDDDIHDDYFWYAGHGGRNPKTGRQADDQDLNYHNQGLARSQTTGRPVRVFRRIASPPAERQLCYEGLLQVVAHEYVTGKSGYQVWRFRLEYI
ncbi:YDG/SRA domain-containing protein [Hymenobacter nivis]|uniref:YDG domain-containing protein n=1 Tax=Hymenobacter nivis TaxID=1850093 RepID=A0A2Z3GHE0_9BACT|nr:YDG/SRA domain-containing protein [Hymenobacter nivis]AWM33349.1 hypothetical protein DDQ68_11480 [Hymenobacter nivis]